MAKDILPEGQQPVRTARGGMSGARTGRSTFDEAEAVTPDEFEPQIGGGERGTRGGEESGDSPISGMFKRPGVKKPDQIATVKGNIFTPRPADEAQLLAESTKRIFESDMRARIAQLDTMGYSEVQMAKYANVASANAIEGERLHREHFEPAKRKLDRLYQQVEDARSMQVNPFNWHEKIGRGGRVSAAFAVLTGQMAAGAGNPNSSLKLMEAAIERDISAQEQNIKNHFASLKLQSGIAQDQRALHEEEVASLNNLRAQAYAAIQAKIGVAQQHAVNATHAEALSVAHDHFNVQQLNAMQAARQQIFIEMDAAVDASTAREMLAQVESMKQSMSIGTPLGPDPAQVAAPAQRSVAAVPGRAGAVGARRGRPVRPGTTPQPALVAGTSEPRGREDEALQMSVAEEAAVRAPREAPSRGLKGLGEKAYRGQRVTRKDVANELRQHEVPSQVLKDGSYGRAFRLEQGEGGIGALTWEQALADVAAGRKLSEGGFLMNRDADFFKAMLPEPKRSQFPPPKDGRDSPEYVFAKQIYDYGQEYEEIYEARATVDGQRNTIVAGGMSYKLAEGAIARTDPKAYKKMQEKLADVASGIRASKVLSDQIQRVGLSGMFTTDDGFQIPGITTGDPSTLRMQNQLITQAMQYIKTHDPTARISDKDLEVGRQAMAGFATKGGAFMDFIQSLDFDPSNNTKRKQIERFLVAISVESQRLAWEKFENELVPDYNTMVSTREDAMEMQNWLDKKRED